MNFLAGHTLILGLIIGIAQLKDGTVTELNTEVSSEQISGTDAQPEPEPESEVGDESEIPEWERNVRLPKHLLPLHYDLYLHPDLDTGLFTGDVEIRISALQESSFLLVHVKDLEIASTTLVNDEDKSNIPILESFEFTKNEFWVVRPKSALSPGNYSLGIRFSGSLTNGITGFYKSVYKNKDGEQISIATSKFQPTDARKAFPCFDEPSFKSTFTTKLVRPSVSYTALSNMPVASEKPDTPRVGLTEVTFEKSVPMVTYLACFIVCNFEYKETLTSEHNTRFRVYATPEQVSSVEYALDLGANVTDFFTDYYDIPFPLPKQDMIAIPDFVSGAMEHWGLITYRETNLLYDEKKSSAANQQRVAVVVSHELAHQWFGNLVTLDWWDDLWLNEGFASYMEYKGVANYHPEWELETQFLTLDLHRVLDLDATINSHPIVQPVNHPDQITEIFDAISYGKGASVLRMLENFMGPEEFRQGVHDFLDKFKYKNAVTDDLWAALESVSSQHLNIKDIMDTWTRQMGYPLIKVESEGGGVYRVSQQRYLTDPSVEDQSPSSPYSYKWEVPITWVSSSNNQTSTKWLARGEAMTQVVVDPEVSWLKFNVGQFGFYRVLYPTAEWGKLAAVLEEDPQSLQPMDRASLINDAFCFAESGHIDYSIPLSMTNYLSKESHLVPWDTAYSSLMGMSNLLKKTFVYPKFRKYILDLVSDHYDKLGWKDEGTHMEKLNRFNILGLSCMNGLTKCLTEAGQLFTAWIADPLTYISPNLRSLVYKYGMAARGSPETWEIMFKRYLDESNAQEKRKLLYGLAQIKEQWILHRFILLAQNETYVRSQDYFTALSYVSGNPIGESLVWDFIQAEWPKLVDRFTLNNRYLGRLPKLAVTKFTTEFQLKQVEDFFATYPEAGAGARARKQAVEQVKNNIKWLSSHQEVVGKWLDAREKRI